MISQLRGCWHCWKQAARDSSHSTDVRVAEFRSTSEHIAVRQCWATWRQALSLCQQGNRCRVRRVFLAWRRYTAKHASQRPGRCWRQMVRRRVLGRWVAAYNARRWLRVADTCLAERLQRKAWFAWRQCTVLRRAECVALLAVSGSLDRQLLRDGFAVWSKRHHEARSRAAAEELLRRGHRRRVLVAAFRRWHRFVLYRRGKRLQRLRADIFFKTTFLSPTKRQAISATHGAPADADRARLVVQYRCLIRCFRRWHGYVAQRRREAESRSAMVQAIQRRSLLRCFKIWRGATASITAPLHTTNECLHLGHTYGDPFLMGNAPAVLPPAFWGSSAPITATGRTSPCNVSHSPPSRCQLHLHKPQLGRKAMLFAFFSQRSGLYGSCLPVGPPALHLPDVVPDALH
eukprot:EG_transcript_5116